MYPTRADTASYSFIGCTQVPGAHEAGWMARARWSLGKPGKDQVEADDKSQQNREKDDANLAVLVVFEGRKSTHQ